MLLVLALPPPMLEQLPLPPLRGELDLGRATSIDIVGMLLSRDKLTLGLVLYPLLIKLCPYYSKGCWENPTILRPGQMQWLLCMVVPARADKPYTTTDLLPYPSAHRWENFSHRLEPPSAAPHSILLTHPISFGLSSLYEPDPCNSTSLPPPHYRKGRSIISG